MPRTKFPTEDGKLIDLYAVLGVSHAASKKEIKAAYCTVALKEHPDKNLAIQTDATRLMQTIAAAHEILSDTDRRAQYDIAFHNLEDDLEEETSYQFPMAHPYGCTFQTYRSDSRQRGA